jgi:hypothetical protein
VDPRASLEAVAKRKILSHCRESNPGRPARSLITTLTEMFRLLYYFQINGIFSWSFVDSDLVSHLFILLPAELLQY